MITSSHPPSHFLEVVTDTSIILNISIYISE